MTKINKNLLVIIPAFNEQDVVSSVIGSVPKKVKGIDKVDILVVDDGSKDNTAEKAEKAGAIITRHKKNRGVGAALATGFDYALKYGYDFVVNIDADGQFEAGEIPKLIEPILAQEADMVVGNRFKDGRPANMPLVKYYGNILMNKLISYLAQENFSDVSCGFRAYSREALLNLNLFGNFTYTQETFLDLSFKKLNIRQISVQVKYFPERKSKVAGNLFSYTYKTLNIILRSIVYYRPLRFFGYPGIISFLIGLFFIGFLLYHKISTGNYSPYKAYGFIGGGLILFGLILFLIGLLADMIDKIRRTQERILYYEKKRNYERYNPNDTNEIYFT